MNLTVPGLRLLRRAPGDRPLRPPPPAPATTLVTDAGEALVTETGTPIATGPR